MENPIESRDPLADLRVDAVSVDREALAEMLRGHVLLDPEGNQIIFLNDVREVGTNVQVVALALLGQKALHLLDRDLPEGLTPAEIEQATKMAGGSVRSSLKRLSDRGVILKQNGRYVVPGHTVEKLGKKLDNLN